ncbi:MAG TPA: divalent-cation tolerance protein CutA [Alphaproteobacteria bacterium]|nr:divalent-cation tolerance protein CutA [Alphaproteobacteria bacterium]
MIYVTAADRAEAERLGRSAVEAGLAACANILPGMTSIYRWQGGVEQAEEAVLILKTRRDLVEPLTDHLKAGHGYAVPCVVALPILGGNAEYLDWIAAETAPGGGIVLPPGS